MNTDLETRLDEVRGEVDDKAFDVLERKVDAQKLVHRLGIHGLENMLDEMTLKSLLLRFPQQKVILREFPSHYEIVTGYKLLNTLYAVLQNTNMFTPRNLERRLEDIEIDLIVLRAGMNDKQVEYAIKLLTA
jgi:hypothetical protein